MLFGRQVSNIHQFELSKPNAELNEISKEKYDDLMSLCSGRTALIKNDECKSLYGRLPHN